MNNFISESEIAEKRKIRQEEWDKVRKAEDPVEAPEEPYDPRSLYERLKEQKDKKQEDFEETLKFKNQFRGVNRDEAEFLDHVALHTAQLEKKKNDEVKKELKEFKKAIAQRGLQENKTATSNENKNVDMVKKNVVKKQTLQSNILKTAVKRKSDSNLMKLVTKQDETPDKNDNDIIPTKRSTKEAYIQPVIVYPSAQKCVGLLPGISSYGGDSDTSSSEVDLDDDDDSSDA